MTEVPSLAVIVPLLNEEACLMRHGPMFAALDADELLFVDGGSTDATRQILRRHGLGCIRGQAGRARQMNAGAAGSKSDILLFIHADTKLSSGHLSDVRAVMQQPDIVGGRFDVRLSGGHWAFRMIEFMMNWRSRLTGISTGDQGIFVRRSVFERMGGFADMPLMEDIEFSGRLKRQGRIACLPARITTSSRRWEQHGIFNTVLLMWKIRLLYWWGYAPEKLAGMYRHAR